jgi:hypothetical protein
MSGASVFYYPYDASLPLLSSAIKAVRDSAPARDRLRINALGADFDQLKTIGPIFRQRSNPKVVALFGHSLGSSQREDELLRMAKGAMSIQDALVLEVPLTDRWCLLERLALEQYGSFYFGPLAALGVPYEQQRMTFSTGQGLSAIPETVTCSIGYRGFELDGKRYRHASLAYIHLYDENAVVRAVEDAGFELLVNQLGTLDRGFAVIVARRKR